MVGLLFVPAIQTYAVNKITEKVSKSWGTELSIRDVHLTPTLKLLAHGVRIHDNHHQDMIYVGTVKGRIRSISLKPLRLKFGEVTFDKANVVIRKYKGDNSVNIAIWARKFATGDTTKSMFQLTSSHFIMKNSRFVYINDGSRKVFNTANHPGIDYAFFELKDINWETYKFSIVGSSISANFKHLAFNQYGGFSLKDASGNFNICDTSLTFNKMKLFTKGSKIDADFKFKYDTWNSYGDFNNVVRFLVKIRPSIVDMQDVAGFAPQIKGMKEVVFLSASRFDGPVNDFKIINLHAGWGMKNYVHGDIGIKNVTHFRDVIFNIQLDTCNIDMPELANFTLPNGKTIPKNAMMNKFGNIALHGFFIGNTSVFDAKINATSALGPLFADLSTLAENGKLKIKGAVKSPMFNIAKLTNLNDMLGYSDLSIFLDGTMDSPKLSKSNFKTLKAHLSGTVNRFDLMGYTLKNTKLDGQYQNKLYQCKVMTNDPHLACIIDGTLNLNYALPTLKGSIDLNNFEPGAIAQQMPRVDSATAKGFDKIIATAQRNPYMRISFDQFDIALKGNNLENVNGYIGCDNIRIYNKPDSLDNARFRLTALNVNRVHKFILSSNIANASMETTYPLRSLPDSLMNIAYSFFPNLIPAQSHHIGSKQYMAKNEVDFLNIHVNTYHSRNLLNLIQPDLFIAPNSTVDIALSSDTIPNTIKVHIPRGGFRHKLAIHNFNIDGRTADNSILQLDIQTDSAIAIMNDNKFSFNKISLSTQTKQNVILYNLNWHNDFNKDPNHNSLLAGMIDASDPDDILINVRKSLIYLKDNAWTFNDDNAIHIQDKLLTFNNLQFKNQGSEIVLNGTYSKTEPGKITLYAKNADLSLINPLLSNMSFGGDLSANISIDTKSKKMVLTGKALATDFVFNDEKLGNLFLVAGSDTPGQIGFSGGIFDRGKYVNSNIVSNYSIRDFQHEKNIIAEVNGNYANDKKRLAVHANFDTLKAGFLSPFLSGFSNYLKGTASGKLSFYAMPDTTYFDGKVHVIDADMGISALGTDYKVQNQDILFNKQGIVFNQMLIKDKDGNTAYMDGHIDHQSFKNMKLDLNINTSRILILNTEKTPTSVFYGIGYVAGKVAITGSGGKMFFKGQNLQTLSGSKIVLQVSSSSAVSQSNLIKFKPKPTATVSSNPSTIVYDTTTSTDLNFDFTFNVTNDADVVLYLESIGGTLNGRTDGQLQLTYNNNEGLNLYGNLLLHSGDFKISLFNVVNSKFTLVPGGNIQFDGPLDNMLVKVSAYKSSKASLSNIIPQEYLSGNSANANVNAYLHLNGPLMQRIEPTFSFELPNSSNEVRNLFYTSIDTSNTENITKQFAYFLITNSFMPNDMFSTGSTTNIGASGYSMLSSIVNSMINSILANKNASFGLTYNQASETSSAEYGVKANANLLQDRINVATNIGYYDDRTQTANTFNNMYGDFTVEYSLNKSGTWKMKAYTYIGERNEDYIYDAQINYTAGVAIVYKQDFNTPVRRKNKEAIRRKKNNKDEK